VLISSTLRYLPAQVVAPLLQISVFLYWTFHLPSEVLGFLNLGIASQELFSSLLLVWWQHYVLRFRSEPREGPDAARFIASEVTVMTLVLLAHLACMSLFLAFWAKDAPVSTLLAALCYSGGQALAVYLSDRARALNDTFAYTVLQICGPAGGLAASAAGFALGDLTASWPLAGLGLGYLAGCLYDIARRWGFRGWIPRPGLSFIQAGLRFGGPLILANIFIWTIFNIGRYVIDYALGTEAVGQFSVGYGLGMRALSITAMLVVAAGYPLAVRRLNEEGTAAAIGQLRRNALLLLALVIPATAGLFAVTPLVVDNLVGANYRAVALVVLPLAALAGALRSVQSHVFEQCLLLFKRSHVVAAVTCAMAALVLLLTLPTVLSFGVVGVLYALLAVQGVSIFVLGLYCRRETGFTIPIPETGKVFLASLSVFVPGFFVTGTGPLSLAIAVLGGVGLYTLAMFILFRNDAISLLKRLRPA